MLPQLQRRLQVWLGSAPGPGDPICRGAAEKDQVCSFHLHTALGVRRGPRPACLRGMSHRPRRHSRGSSRVAARGWWLSSPHSQDLSGPRCVCQAGPSLLEMRVLHGLSRLRSSFGALCLLADVPQVLEGWVVAAGICLLVSPPCFLSVFALLSGTFLPLHQPFFAVVTVF